MKRIFIIFLLIIISTCLVVSCYESGPQETIPPESENSQDEGGENNQGEGNGDNPGTEEPAIPETTTISLNTDSCVEYKKTAHVDNIVIAVATVSVGSDGFGNEGEISVDSSYDNNNIELKYYPSGNVVKPEEITLNFQLDSLVESENTLTGNLTATLDLDGVSGYQPGWVGSSEGVIFTFKMSGVTFTFTRNNVSVTSDSVDINYTQRKES